MIGCMDGMLLTDSELMKPVSQGDCPEYSAVDISRELGQNANERMERQRRNFQEVRLQRIMSIMLTPITEGGLRPASG
jgi:hypothetical protein